MVPQQVVCPATGLTESVHVRPAKKEGLHIHLLDVEFSAHNLAMDPLMAGIEPAGTAAQRDQPGLFLQADDRWRIGPGICELNLNLHMLASLEARHRLCRM